MAKIIIEYDTKEQADVVIPFIGDCAKAGYQTEFTPSDKYKAEQDSEEDKMRPFPVKKSEFDERNPKDIGKELAQKTIDKIKKDNIKI